MTSRGRGRDRAPRGAGRREVHRLPCLDLIADGDTIFLDSGTTIEQLALALAERRRTDRNAPRVTVLTNSLAVTQAVAETPGIEHVVLGGRFRPVDGTFVGPLTLQTVERLTPQTAFISVSGLAADGITVVDLDEAQLKAAVIERAGRVVVAADHSKIGAIDFAPVCELSDIDVIVTDRISPELETLCADAEARLVSRVSLIARRRPDAPRCLTRCATPPATARARFESVLRLSPGLADLRPTRSVYLRPRGGSWAERR